MRACLSAGVAAGWPGPGVRTLRLQVSILLLRGHLLHRWVGAAGRGRAGPGARALLPATRVSNVVLSPLLTCTPCPFTPPGRRNFADFLGQYLAPQPGRCVSVGMPGLWPGASVCVCRGLRAPACGPWCSPRCRRHTGCAPERRPGRRGLSLSLIQSPCHSPPPTLGSYVDVDSGRELGPCPDLAAVTHGQRPGIGGAADRVYAVGKDVVSCCGCLLLCDAPGLLRWRACCRQGRGERCSAAAPAPPAPATHSAWPRCL